MNGRKSGSGVQKDDDGKSSSFALPDRSVQVDLSERADRQSGASVTASAIGMGLALQSGSLGGLKAFAATQSDGVSDANLQVASDGRATAQDMNHSPSQMGINAKSDVAQLGEAVEVAAIGPDGDAVRGVTDGLIDGESTQLGDMLSGAVPLSSGIESSASAEDIASPPSASKPEGAIEDGAAGSGVGSLIFGDGDAGTGSGGGGLLEPVIGDGGILDIVTGEDGLLGAVVGDGGVVDSLIGGDGLVAGLVDGISGITGGVLAPVLGDGGLIDSLVGDGGIVDTIIGEDGLIGAVLGGGGILDVVTGEDGLLGAVVGDGGVVDSLIGGDGLVAGLSDGISGVLAPVLGDDGLIDSLVGDGGIVDTVIGEDGLIGAVLGGGGVLDVVTGEDGLLGAVAGDGGVVESLIGGDGLVAGLVDGISGVLAPVLGDGGLIDSLVGDGGIVDTVIGEDGLIGAVLGGGGILDVVTGEDSLLGAVLGGGGLLGGLFGRGGGLLGRGANPTPPVDDVLAQGELAETIASDVGTGGVDAIDDVASSVAAGGTEDLAGPDGDDGFLDTLIGGVGADGLSQTIDAVGSLLGDAIPSVLDGLLGDDDVFSIDVSDTDGGSGDLFAGLSGVDGLSGSLIDQGLLDVSTAIDNPEPDPEIDGLLNDILAGGVAEIFGGSSELDALLHGDTSADDRLGSDGADSLGLIDATAVEGALGVLFDQGADQPSSLLGDLFTTNDDDVS